MTVFALGDDAPQIHDSAYAADSATIIGKVILAKDASVWTAGRAARRQRRND